MVVIAGTLALAATLAIHVGYSYSRHLATGWLLDAYPRYYRPLAAIVPLAGLSLAATIEAPRWRAALLAFSSPVRFFSAFSARRSASLARAFDRAGPPGRGLVNRPGRSKP